MDIRYKFYPYPVLTHYSDDYADSSFEVVIDTQKDGYNIRIDFLAELNNLGLSQLLSGEKIKIVYHLECAQTGYRIALSTGQNELSHLISSKLICGRMQICPFIVAAAELPEYFNEKFHEDYRGFKFAIESGCVLAVGKQVNVDIESDINDLSYTPSVFCIVKNDDTGALGMVVDMDQKKIVIKLPEQDFINYKSIKDEALWQPVLNSLVIVPALTYVLEEVVKRDSVDRYEYDSYAWYRAINKALATKFNCDIGGDEFSESNMLEMAQKLINVPLSDALKTLSNGTDVSPEEDEE